MLRQGCFGPRDEMAVVEQVKKISLIQGAKVPWDLPLWPFLTRNTCWKVIIAFEDLARLPWAKLLPSIVLELQKGQSPTKGCIKCNPDINSRELLAFYAEDAEEAGMRQNSSC